MQKKKGDYADQPFIYALAWYLETDIFILHKGNNQIYNIVSSSLDGTINRTKPPMILGLQHVHYQSYAPLDGAGMLLDQMEGHWQGKRRMAEE